jgi:putative transcriptional regulator
LIQPVRHPSEDLIFDFARGAMEPGRGLVLATHLIACPACRAAARLAEAVGGALIDQLEPAQLAPDALARAMARLDLPAPAATKAPRAPEDWIGVPPEVRLAAKRNRRWAAPGVWVAPVTRDRRTGARSYLLGIGPGIAVPRHTHRGLELVCVLKGAYHDLPPGRLRRERRGDRAPAASDDGRRVRLPRRRRQRAGGARPDRPAYAAAGAHLTFHHFIGART